MWVHSQVDRLITLGRYINYVINNDIKVHHLYITFLGGVGAVPARTKRLANLGESTQPNLNLRAYSFRLVIGGYRRVRQITTHRHHRSLASMIRLQIVHTPAKQSTATASARPQAAAARLLSFCSDPHALPAYHILVLHRFTLNTLSLPRAAIPFRTSCLAANTGPGCDSSDLAVLSVRGFVISTSTRRSPPLLSIKGIDPSTFIPVTHLIQ